MVVFDATMLLLLLRPNSGRPTDSSGNPVTEVEERIAYLVQRLERQKSRIIIPTPSLSEVLVHAGEAGPGIVETLTRSTVFKIMPFDTVAAVEAALMTRAALSTGDKRRGLATSWAKVKFDRQIVAIAKVARVTMIYSDDADVRALAAAEDIPVIGLAELPLPAEPELPLAPPSTEEADDSDPESDEATGEAVDDDKGPEQSG
jgi:hypothetical protein